MEVEEDNNNNSEGIKGGIESEGKCKDLKRGNNNDNNNNLVAEEKGSLFEVQNDELEAQFNACVMNMGCTRSKRERYVQWQQ